MPGRAAACLMLRAWCNLISIQCTFLWSQITCRLVCIIIPLSAIAGNACCYGSHASADSRLHANCAEGFSQCKRIWWFLVSIVLTLMIDITQKMNCFNPILVACLRMLWSQSVWYKQGNSCSSSMPFLGIHWMDLLTIITMMLCGCVTHAPIDELNKEVAWIPFGCQKGEDIDICHGPTTVAFICKLCTRYWLPKTCSATEMTKNYVKTTLWYWL